MTLCPSARAVAQCQSCGGAWLALATLTPSSPTGVTNFTPPSQSHLPHSDRYPRLLQALSNLTWDTFRHRATTACVCQGLPTLAQLFPLSELIFCGAQTFFTFIAASAAQYLIILQAKEEARGAGVFIC